MPSGVTEGETNAFAEQLEFAQFGKGSRYFEREEATAFAEYACSKGFGVSRMEAFGTGASRGKVGLYHQLLGLDDLGLNWKENRNPERALDVFKQKLSEALDDGLALKYKIWLETKQGTCEK
ncbi:hypothetical protein [Sulfitobacter sp. 20_GPM-1509m]|uniref:hypothetical protein n=1 Tax=Sulfitobacter sp. 20_GPM-1509m TaxID=1380367 RepID=UPI00048D080C|nr:hypothetical protein [Sulfitobacter sp. 20_GPM-1509m]